MVQEFLFNLENTHFVVIFGNSNSRKQYEDWVKKIDCVFFKDNAMSCHGYYGMDECSLYNFCSLGHSVIVIIQCTCPAPSSHTPLASSYSATLGIYCMQ